MFHPKYTELSRSLSGSLAKEIVVCVPYDVKYDKIYMRSVTYLNGESKKTSKWMVKEKLGFNGWTGHIPVVQLHDPTFKDWTSI